MTKRSRRSWSGLLLAVSNFGNFAFPLVRGVALARLLSPQDFGLAISITLVSTVVELISDVGLAQYAVRVDDNAVPTLHSIALIRGALLACAIALCGPVFALAMKAPETSWIYLLVGAGSLIRGFSHFGVKTAMRTYDFVPEAVTDLTSHLVWTVVSIGSAVVLHDYKSMVFGLLAYSVTYVVVTHLLAKSKWRLAWEYTIVKDSTRFGRLMMPNGVAIALVNMGDRTLVGSSLGLDALAYYSVLSTSAFTPRAAVIRFLNSLVTPQFVNATAPQAADRLLVIWALVLSFIGSFFAFGYMAFGQPLIALVFGQHYAVGQEVVALVAVLACVRYLTTITTPPSIAKGNTGLIFLNTATSASGLALGLGFVMISRTMEAMLAGMCIGELLALLYIVRELLKSHAAASRSVWIVVVSALALVLACGVTIHIGAYDTLGARVEVCLGFVLAEALILVGKITADRLSIRDVASIFVPAHV